MLRDLLFRSWLFRLPATQSRLLLTCDDGPHPDSTPRLLDLFNHHNILATHFLLGKNCQSFPHLVRDLHSAKQQLAVHGYDHESCLFKSAGYVRASLANTERAVQAAGGVVAKYFRPPYGRFNMRTAKAAESCGFKGVLWSHLIQDWVPDSSARVHTNLLNSIQSRAIIVLHDSPAALQNYASTLPEFVARVRDQGLEFSLLPEDNSCV